MLIESTEDGIEGRAACQGPEVDGTTVLTSGSAEIGEYVSARVVATDGVDLIASVVP